MLPTGRTRSSGDAAGGDSCGSGGRSAVCADPELRRPSVRRSERPQPDVCGRNAQHSGALPRGEHQRRNPWLWRTRFRCSAGDDCFAVLTSYIAGSPYIDPVAAIAAVGAAIGSPVLECTNTSGCDHPRAACIPTASVPGVGYCQPNSTATVAKEVCYAGLHCSCDELLAAAIGFAVGLGLQVAANAFTSPIGSAVELVMQTTIDDFY